MSALNDVEAQLITYLLSDTESSSDVDFDKDIVINLTSGNYVNHYKDQEEVSNVIVDIWTKVLYDELRWVNTPVLEKLRSDSLFKYSPIKALTTQQSEVINEIINTPNKSFVIKGDAGTGKTVLLTHIAASLIDQTNKSIAIVVQPNWEKLLRKSLRFTILVIKI